LPKYHVTNKKGDAMKTKVLITGIAVLASLSSTAAIAGETQNLSYSGVVKPLMVDQVKYGTNLGYRGIITEIANIGEYVFPTIKKSSGEVVKQGTELVAMDSKYWETLVEAGEASLVAAEENLKTAKANYERAEKLVVNHSISDAQRDQYRAAYYTALGGYITSKATLYQQQKQLEMCHIYSSTEGIVTNRYIDPGEIPGGEPTVLEITQLNPIGVKVTLPVEVINNLSADASIIVKDSSGNTLDVQGNLLNISGNDIMFKVSNKLKYLETIEINGKTLPVISLFQNVLKFYTYKNNDSLAVPIDTVKKDSKGTYVWTMDTTKKAVGYPENSSVFNIKKTYIEVGDLETIKASTTKVIIVKENNDLKLNDLIVEYGTDNLTDGQPVFLARNRFLLMPGDTLTVQIVNN